MSRLPGLLKRTSKAEELELEEARQVSVARLERLLAHRAGVDMDDGDLVGDDGERPADLDESSMPDDDAAAGAIPEARALVAIDDAKSGPDADPDADLAVSAATRAAAAIKAAGTHAGVPVMDAQVIDVTRRRAVRRPPSAVVVEDDWDVGSGTPEDVVATAAATPATTETEAAEASAAGPDETAVSGPEATPVPGGAFDRSASAAIELPGLAAASPKAGRVARPRTTIPSPAPRGSGAPGGEAPKRTRAKGTAASAGKAARPAAAASTDVKPAGKAPVPPPPPRLRTASGAAVHPKRAARQPRQPAVLAACPSCAVLLDPRPTASRRCTVCRERIVVKRLEGGVLYLTATAGAALAAAQRRVTETARFSRARGRWLAQAAAVGASPAAIDRLGDTVATEEGVLGARALYLGAANRAFLAARRERRFAEAATIRRSHALALVRELDTPDQVPDEIVSLYRDAMSAELKSLREFGRDVELVGGGCCDACGADRGLIARVTEELKVARLPHAGCTKGICRCRWATARVSGRRPAIKGAPDR